MKKKTSLQVVAGWPSKAEAASIVSLLLKDHRAMRQLMEKINSKRSTPRTIVATFGKLEQLVKSHMKAEEEALLNRIREHELFEDKAKEGIEEHRVHELVMANVHRVRDIERKAIHAHIFCEILEHHLKEEEKGLFPRVQKRVALSTRKKIGAVFAKKRHESSAAAS